ncbi:MAG: SDR family NAD(P)-dependent oxidoreductase, partial [Gammaproteobacteria bacterium]
MRIDLTGKTALVTGASRGIGAAIFRAFGESGAAVLGTATGDAGLAAINAAAAEYKFRGAAKQYDAANPADA